MGGVIYVRPVDQSMLLLTRDTTINSTETNYCQSIGNLPKLLIRENYKVERQSQKEGDEKEEQSGEEMSKVVGVHWRVL